MEQPPDAEIRELIEQRSAEVSELALQLRSRILGLVQGVEEEAYFDWGQIGFACGTGMKRQFCAIALQEKRVDLIFNRGIDLDDPAGLLEGVGKKARHVKIASAEDLARPAVEQLILAAARIAAAEG